MNRLFGSTNTAPAKTIAQTVEDREQQLSKLDVEIRGVVNEIDAGSKKLRSTTRAYEKNRLKQDLKRLLKRRNDLYARRDNLQSQLDTLGVVRDTGATVADTKVMYQALKTSAKTVRKELGGIDIDEIERMNDDLADLADIQREIQEAISRGIAPEAVDEDELDAELEELGQEAEFDFELERASAAGFLEDEVPDFIDEPVGADKPKVQEVAR